MDTWSELRKVYEKLKDARLQLVAEDMALEGKPQPDAKSV
jgi:hypothetical protein